MTRKLPRHLTWLEAFAAAVDTGSLDGAALHLGVARSVVSEHLKALEQAVTAGAPLLERGPGRRLKLTARGERLYEATQAPLHQLDLKRLQDAASPEPSLRIGLNPTLSSLLLEPLSQELARRGLRMEASFGGAFDLVRQVQTRQLDLALGFTPLPPHRGVEALRLVDLPFVVLASPDCPLPRRARLKVEHLEGLPFVDWLRDDPYGGANRARFEAAAIQVRETARVESFLQLYPALRAFGACAIAPDLRKLGPFPKDLVVKPFLEASPQPVAVVGLLPEGLADSAARDVLAWMRKKLRR